MSDAAFADFTRSFSALSDCKRLPHGISDHCRSAKAVHTRFQCVAGLQKPSTRSFGALSDCKSRPHAVFACCQNAKGHPHAISVRCQRTKANPHAVSVHCQTAKAVHTRFQRIVGLQKGFHTRFHRVVRLQKPFAHSFFLLSVYKMASTRDFGALSDGKRWSPCKRGLAFGFRRTITRVFYTNKTRRCV